MLNILKHEAETCIICENVLAHRQSLFEHGARFNSSPNMFT